MTAKTSAKKKAAAPHKTAGSVRTQFMGDFVAKFIRSPGATDFTWPEEDLSAPDVLAEFEMILDVLLRAGYLRATPAPDGSDSLRNRVINYLNAKDWPDSAPIPAKWAGIEPTVRLIEVSVITDHLLQAINSHAIGSGGGGTTWPPHPP